MLETEWCLLHRHECRLELSIRTQGPRSDLSLYPNKPFVLPFNLTAPYMFQKFTKCIIRQERDSINSNNKLSLVILFEPCVLVGIATGYNQGSRRSICINDA
jgi:hypothetical protein